MLQCKNLTFTSQNVFTLNLALITAWRSLFDEGNNKEKCKILSEEW